MRPPTISGVILQIQSGLHTVLSDAGEELTCFLRGRLKRNRVEGDILAIGDRVQVSIQQDGKGMIEAIEPRVRVLSRLDPRPRGSYRQILMSNLDQILLVFACAQPDPHLRMLDRFLVICEKNQIPPIIVANKVDLIGQEHAQRLFGHYPALGYPVIYSSVTTGQGVSEIKHQLTGKLSGLAGPSGVGKSSLLNAIQPALGLAVRAVSDVTEKGRHTTVTRRLFPFSEGGFVADLPGLKSLALWDTQPEELDGYFPELRARVADCRFSDCTHRDEPDCAVRHGLDAGEISPERYQSYLRMRYGDPDDL